MYSLNWHSPAFLGKDVSTRCHVIMIYHGAFLAVFLFAAVQPLSHVRGETACESLTTLQTAGQVFGCGEELLRSNETSKSQAQSLREVLGVLKDFRESCLQGLHVNTVTGCQTLHSLVLELVSLALYQLWTCEGVLLEVCNRIGQAIYQTQTEAWEVVRTQHQGMEPGLVARSMRELDDRISKEYNKAEPDMLPASWRIARLAVKELYYWVTALIWRETQWQWLSDSLEAQKVVHTAWGDPDEWLRFGVTDCHADAPLLPNGPRYSMNEEPRFTGLRFQVLAELLQDLRKRRGGGELLVVEIGVFVGQLSKFILQSTDFVRLVGVDPYLGDDGTFPGHFSRDLHPDIAFHQAASIYESFGERAMLLPTTSSEAAGSLANRTVDAVFIDGCHLYSCVKTDFQTWMPKLRNDAEVLVAGHDFSPQWPGVVQAVHEERTGQRDVTISTDWLFWWFQPPQS